MILDTLLSCFSHIWLFETPWTVARQPSLSMGFSRQEYWSGLPSPPPGDLPHPWFRPTSLMSPALAGRFSTTRTTWNNLSLKLKLCVLNRVQVSVTPWTVACQAPLSLEFSRQEYWSGLPFPTPRNLPGPGIQLASPALVGGFLTLPHLRRHVNIFKFVSQFEATQLLNVPFSTHCLLFSSYLLWFGQSTSIFHLILVIAFDPPRESKIASLSRCL